MYVTAHRVRTQSLEEGINAYLYMHGSYLWPRPPEPEENPGSLTNMLLTVDTVGGNHVRSYLDIVGPDEVFWPTIRSLFIQFLARMISTPLPWKYVVGPCLFRIGMELPLVRSWRNEVDLLYRACVTVHPS